MELEKIKINNFKSINKLEINVKKIGDSYLNIFVGLNESGKSNLLQAISFYNKPEGNKYNFDLIKNQKNNKCNSININFYLKFKSKNDYLESIKNKFDEASKNLLDFELTSIHKRIYLQKGKGEFLEEFDFTPNLLSKRLFIKKEQKEELVNGENQTISYFVLKKENDEKNPYQELSPEIIIELFKKDLIEIIKKKQPNLSFWKYSPEYLISEPIKLNEFKEDINSNIPLKNIFSLFDNLKTLEEIKSKIETLNYYNLRSRFESEVEEKINEYFKKAWKHNIHFIVEINDNLIFTIIVNDDGEENKHDRHTMSSRSDGFKQFVSLILSLSIESRENKNRIILIDEPETHLHPSGIRDLGKELKKIGENNYLFISTHSPFLVDTDNKERNFIVKKNIKAETIIKNINDYQDLYGDEVLEEAFGINVFKDLLGNHKVLVEGLSDKIILEKCFRLEKIELKTTNGSGGNIIQVASLLNHHKIDLLVLVDDDKKGKEFKEKIIKIGSVFTKKNVFTIRDIVGDLNEGSSIEDFLGKKLVESQFKEFYKEEFKKDIENFELSENSPFIEQLKTVISQENNNLNKEKKKEVILKFKKEISNKFEPSLNSFKDNFPLLKKLISQIKKKLNISPEESQNKESQN